MLFLHLVFLPVCPICSGFIDSSCDHITTWCDLTLHNFLIIDQTIVSPWRVTYNNLYKFSVHFLISSFTEIYAFAWCLLLSFSNFQSIIFFVSFHFRFYTFLSVWLIFFFNHWLFSFFLYLYLFFLALFLS